MILKKANGKIFGVTLSKTEQRAMDMEIKRQLVEWDRKHMIEIDAIVLWELHRQFGFGYDRLKRFYWDFTMGIEALIERYELDDNDKVWVCTHKLKDELDIDLEDWCREKDAEDARDILNGDKDALKHHQT